MMFKGIWKKEDNINKINNMHGPSVAYPKTFKKFNQHPGKILNLQPPECHGPPVMLSTQFSVSFFTTSTMSHWTFLLNCTEKSWNLVKLQEVFMSQSHFD